MNTQTRYKQANCIPEEPKFPIDDYEQGKKLQSYETAFKIMFIAGIAFGFFLCFMLGSYRAKMYYTQLMKEQDSITYQTALKDYENDNIQPNAKRP